MLWFGGQEYLFPASFTDALRGMTEGTRMDATSSETFVVLRWYDEGGVSVKAYGPFPSRLKAEEWAEKQRDLDGFAYTAHEMWLASQ